MTTHIYTRVSTDEQAKDGVSLDLQRDKCLQYADLHDIDKPGNCLVHTDAGYSASKLERPALNDLRRTLNKGDSLIVLKLDRLTRNMHDLCILIDELRKKDIALHGVGDKLDTSTPGGRLVMQIMGAVAEWERETIRERVKDGMAEVRKQGFHVGSAPWGWALAKHEGPGSLLRPLMPRVKYESMTKAARALRSRGYSWRAIAVDLRLIGDDHKSAKRIHDSPLVSEMVVHKDGYTWT